jgi:uncharacterized protein (DUF1778 family)
MPATRSKRIELRATADDRELIVHAAEACDMKISEFAMSHLVSAARRVLADRTQFALSPEAWTAWQQINDRPARDLPGLRKLMERPSPFSE